MSSVNKTNANGEPESEQVISNLYSDLTFQAIEGEVVHVDVSIAHSAIMAVHAAAQNAHKGSTTNCTSANRSNSERLSHG